MPSDDLQTCFTFHRQRGHIASDAIKLARDDVSAGKHRYPRMYANYNGVNPAFKSGRTMLHWIEWPEEIGLRKVGFADKVYKGIEHTGWYTDDDGARETMRGIVYQWPARNGKPRFIGGYADPCNTDKDGNGPAALSFETFDDAEWAARHADSVAEYAAEMERDYNRAWQAGQKFSDLGGEITTARQACLALIRETKAACEAITQYAAIKATIRTQVQEYLADIRRARKKRDELESSYGRESAFNDGQS